MSSDMEEDRRELHSSGAPLGQDSLGSDVEEGSNPLGSSGLDADLQREIDEALGGRSIEELLDETGALSSGGTRGDVEVAEGHVVPARVVGMDSQMVLFELGRKDQGYVPVEQFDEPPAIGSRMDLAVVRYDKREDMWVLSREGAVERATWEDLSEGQIVEAFVESSNKGGLEVRFGGVKGFMPVSQISIYRVEDQAEYVGQKLRCQVVEVDRREKRVIVSARAVMELEAEQARERLLAELAEGDVREGVVRQVMPYGAFVDLGGVDGLVHVSQMAYGRVENPSQFVQPGQKVQVKVLKIDREANRISLSMKHTQPDPWESVEAKYPPGFLAGGRITKLERFGAFCELEPGLEGLIPIGEISWSQRLRHASEVLEAGQAVQVLVLGVEPERRRISLSLKQAAANPWAGAAQRFPPHSEHLGRVTRTADFGAFVELEPGVEGLVHISELSDRHIRRPEDVVRLDQRVRVRVLDVDESARRIALSMKGVAQSEGAAGPAPEPAGKKKRKRPLRGGLD